MSELKKKSHESDENHELRKENDTWIQSQCWSRFKLLKQRADKQFRVFLPALCVLQDPQSAVGRFARHPLFESKLMMIVNAFVGPKPNALNLEVQPEDVAFDEKRKELFVSGNNAIHVYDFHGKRQRIFAQPYNNLPLHRSSFIFVNSQLGWLLVSDSGNHRVLILNSTDGSLIRTIGSFDSDDNGAQGKFHSPTGVAMHSRRRSNDVMDHRIFVCDHGNHRVQVFNAASGAFLYQFGSFGDGDGQLCNPFHLAFDSERHEVYVTDNSNLRICVFSIDGEFRRFFYHRHQPIFCPVGIVVHPMTSTIIISDDNNHCLQVFDREGRFLKSFGSKGNLNNQFHLPRGLCVDSLSGQIAVTDFCNKRVHIIPFC